MLMKRAVLCCAGCLLTGTVMAQPSINDLPQASIRGTVSLEEAIARRRSRRSFAKGDLTQAQIGQLLWAAQGITMRGPERTLRSVPSAGALFPLAVTLVTRQGIYAYQPEQHALQQTIPGDTRALVSQAALGQDAVRTAPCVIVISAVFERSTGKYGDRGIRYAYMEAGHSCQNVLLQAAALGLDAVPVGAFDDNAVHAVLALPDDAHPLYLIPVGMSAQQDD